MMNVWRVSRLILTLSRLRRSSLSRREREGGAQRRKGEGVKIYEQANTGAVLRARRLRRDSTEAEKRLWGALRAKLPAYKWRRQMPIGPYIADFACFAERIIVEVDGGQHATTEQYDIERTDFLKAQGYRVLRFWNNDVLSNTDGVMERIAESLSHGRGNEQRKLRKGEVEPSSPSHSLVAGPCLSRERGSLEPCQ